jgi:membrane protein DedA with SNARE-associated domain
MHLPTAVLVTAGGALIAEVLYYTIGRELGPRARTRAGRRFAAVYDEAESRFKQRPDLMVYLTRWLFAPIGIPTSLIAGSSQFPLPRFMVGAVAGNIMWIMGYTALGFALGNEWYNASPVFDRYKVYFGVAALLIGLAVVTWRSRIAVSRVMLRCVGVLFSSAAALGPEKPSPRPARVVNTAKPAKR